MKSPAYISMASLTATAFLWQTSPVHKIDPTEIATRVLELGEKVQAQELKCVEVLRRADEVIQRAHAALERSQRKLQHTQKLRQSLSSGQ